MLDQIVRRLFITTPETVNANWTSDIVSLDSIEAELSMSINYENGSSVNMLIYMTFSNDGVNFARDLNTITTITDNTGTLLLDYSGVGTQFARWEIVVTDGSIDITESVLVAKRSH